MSRRNPLQGPVREGRPSDASQADAPIAGCSPLSGFAAWGDRTESRTRRHRRGGTTCLMVAVGTAAGEFLSPSVG